MLLNILYKEYNIVSCYWCMNCSLSNSEFGALPRVTFRASTKSRCDWRSRLPDKKALLPRAKYYLHDQSVFFI